MEQSNRLRLASYIHDMLQSLCPQWVEEMKNYDSEEILQYLLLFSCFPSYLLLAEVIVY